MNKQFNPGKKTVELKPAEAERPSRIRRAPSGPDPRASLARNAWWESREWEIRLAIAGIIFFAVAISAAVIDLGHLLGQ